MRQSLSEKLINNLMTLHPKGFDLSLNRITQLLARLGNPQLKLPPVIHIAGTNGKGSATTYCRYLLESAGYSVHTHTSPHLVQWSERYRIGQKTGSQLVDDAVFADAINQVATANQNEPITVFEILTAVAFVLFSQQPADAVILEVGLGGRFDATNVVANPAACLIMPIALDHVAYLGDTIEKIAFEKAGIIKPHVPVIIGKQDSDAAIEVVTSVAEKKHCTTSIFGQDYMGFSEHGRMVFQNANGLMDLPRPNLVGEHQFANAAAAIETVLNAGFHVNEDQIASALKNIIWPARMQHLTTGKIIAQLPKTIDVWLDGGHNPAAAKTIANELKSWKSKGGKPIIMLAAMINTKDNQGFFAPFQDWVEKVYTVPIDSSDAAVAPQDLAIMAQKAGLDALAMGNLSLALERIAKTHPDCILLICGSLYLAGEILSLNHTPPR